MDASQLKEWNRSPFGRTLYTLAHRLPRDCKAGLDWRLERGFHLCLLDHDFFEFTLAADPIPKSATSLPILPDPQGQGQERFLIWHCPGTYQSERLATFSALLSERKDLTVGLILSQTKERGRALLDYPTNRSLWRSVHLPVLQVFQNYPEASYFTVEKNLFDLGRMGRRLAKLSRLRRLMPW